MWWPDCTFSRSRGNPQSDPATTQSLAIPRSLHNPKPDFPHQPRPRSCLEHGSKRKSRSRKRRLRQLRSCYQSKRGMARNRRSCPRESDDPSRMLTVSRMVTHSTPARIARHSLQVRHSGMKSWLPTISFSLTAYQLQPHRSLHLSKPSTGTSWTASLGINIGSASTPIWVSFHVRLATYPRAGAVAPLPTPQPRTQSNAEDQNL